MCAKPTTLAQLTELFFDWLRKEVKAGTRKQRTLVYYEYQLDHLLAAIGGERSLAELIAWDLEQRKAGWHFVQAAQRLFNWGVKVGLIAANPFATVERPPLGERERILDWCELAHLLRASGPALRAILLAEHLTLGRPQELREVQWQEYREDLHAFALTSFKGKGRTKEKVRLRLLPVIPRLARLLARLRRRGGGPTDPVFVNSRGRPWTANSLLLAVRRACKRAGLHVEEGERVVPYTMRHTAATNATANGVRDRLLADIMGHTNTKTTARYQHLQASHLVEGARRARERRPA